MLKHKILLTLVMLVGLILMLSPISYAAANDGKNEACNTPGVSSALCDTKSNPQKNSVTDLIGRVSLFLAVLGGMIAVIVIVYGGFRYVVSSGDPQKVTTAKNTILYGVVGLIVIAAAQTIIIFVINAVT